MNKLERNASITGDEGGGIDPLDHVAPISNRRLPCTERTGAKSRLQAKLLECGPRPRLGEYASRRFNIMGGRRFSGGAIRARPNPVETKNPLGNPQTPPALQDACKLRKRQREIPNDIKLAIDVNQVERGIPGTCLSQVFWVSTLKTQVGWPCGTRPMIIRRMRYGAFDAGRIRVDAQHETFRPHVIRKLVGPFAGSAANIQHPRTVKPGGNAHRALARPPSFGRQGSIVRTHQFLGFGIHLSLPPSNKCNAWK